MCVRTIKRSSCLHQAVSCLSIAAPPFCPAIYRKTPAPPGLSYFRRIPHAPQDASQSRDSCTPSPMPDEHQDPAHSALSPLVPGGPRHPGNPGPHHHPSRTPRPSVSCSPVPGWVVLSAEKTRLRWSVQEPLLFNPSFGGELGDPQLAVKDSGQGSARIAVWGVFVSHGVPKVQAMYPGGGGLLETTGETHSGEGI